MKKKAFTLLEVVISVTILLLIMVVLYKVLDDTKVLNKKFTSVLKEDRNSNELYKILIEDISESKSQEIGKFRRAYILKLKSFNTYHNAFYINITYLLTREKNLVRIESKDEFDRNKLLKDSYYFDNFFKNAYIDILKSDIRSFKVFRKNDKILFSILNNKNSEELFTAFAMR